jgi:hypothetical protein
MDGSIVLLSLPVSTVLIMRLLQIAPLETMCIVGVSRGFLYLSGPPNLIYYSTYDMYIGVYTIYREYMSEVTSLAHLHCGATMARLICVARSAHRSPSTTHIG